MIQIPRYRFLIIIIITSDNQQPAGETSESKRRSRTRQVMLGRRQSSGVLAAYLSWSMCWSASYIQKGLSMVVHSVMNSIEPPVSADMSQIANSLWTERGYSVKEVSVCKHH